MVRNSVTAHESQAVARAHDIVHWERWLGIFHERTVNHWLAGQHWLAYICNYYYATLHFIVTIAVGVWLYRRRPDYARQLRTAWYMMNLTALLGFKFFPLAPPRLLPNGGFVDTVTHFHTWGSWGDKSVSSHSNLYAAMPSMHIGWSLWVAVSLVYLARHTWVRVLGAMYPLFTLFVIVGTGNHYYLDAVGGAIAFGVGLGLSRLISRTPVLPPLRRWGAVASPATSAIPGSREPQFDESIRQAAPDTPAAPVAERDPRSLADAGHG
jgi:hypothetical protein